MARGNVNFSRFFFTARRDWATRRVGAARLHLRKGDAGDRAAFGSMCRSCQAGRPCRAEWAGGQGRAGWLLPLLLTACSPQHPSLGPCSCSGGPVSPEASLPRWRRGTSHCVPSPLPVPPYRLPWGFAGAPQGGNEDWNLTGAVLRDKHLGVKSERALLMNPWSSALKMPGWAEKVLCPPKQPRYPGTRMGARAGDTPGPPRHY